MEWKVFLTVFATIFVAELGDKTQIATLLFAADEGVNKWLVFAAASFALVAASALGVLVGAGISQYVGERMIHTLAGVGFIAIGIWTLFR